jgi:hypothetical protein
MEAIDSRRIGANSVSEGFSDKGDLVSIRNLEVFRGEGGLLLSRAPFDVARAILSSAAGLLRIVSRAIEYIRNTANKKLLAS